MKPTRTSNAHKIITLTIYQDVNDKLSDICPNSIIKKKYVDIYDNISLKYNNLDCSC